MAKEIKIPDLRAGFAYVMAAVIARDSTLSGLHFDRGYENVVHKLQTLGLDIVRVETDKKVKAAENSALLKEKGTYAKSTFSLKSDQFKFST